MPSSATEVCRPLGLVERLQVTMENNGIGSVFLLGARLLTHAVASDDALIAHWHAQAQHVLAHIPSLSQHVDLRRTEGTPEPHMVCDPAQPASAASIVASTITPVPVSASASSNDVWAAITPIARARARSRIHLRTGPLWSLDLYRPVAHVATTHHHRIVLVLGCSHALIDGRGARNLLDALLAPPAATLPLLTPLDTAPLHPPLEVLKGTTFTTGVLADILGTAAITVLPPWLTKALHKPKPWPNHIGTASHWGGTPQGAAPEIRTRFLVLEREVVSGLKVAATTFSTKVSSGRARGTRRPCTLHATINQALKVAIIVADREWERLRTDKAHLAANDGKHALKRVRKDNDDVVPKRLPYRFFSQNPIDMRVTATASGTEGTTNPFGRFAGNIFGMRVLPCSNATHLPFWTEALAFQAALGSKKNRRRAAANLGVLRFIPMQFRGAGAGGKKDDQEKGPELETGWESFFEATCARSAELAATCNYSNLGLVVQPADAAGSAPGPAADADADADADAAAAAPSPPRLAIEQVCFVQTPQPSSCAFFVDVVGCAPVVPTSSSPASPAAQEAQEAPGGGGGAAGGTITLSLTTFADFLPARVEDVLVAALEGALGLVARGGVDARMGTGEVVRAVEQGLLLSRGGAGGAGGAGRESLGTATGTATGTAGSSVEEKEKAGSLA